MPVAGKVIGAPEIRARSSTPRSTAGSPRAAGRPSSAARLAGVTGREHVALVGSGSQANLLAVAAACSHLHERPLRARRRGHHARRRLPHHGRRRSTSTGSSRSTSTSSPTPTTRRWRRSPRRSARAHAAIMAAHCLGNPFDAAGLERAVRRARPRAHRGLLRRARIAPRRAPRRHLRAVATYSFYAAHHMTTGEGGAVASDDGTWARAVVSLREWGRDCWCPPGRDDVCGRRFEGRFGDLPEGFDHKYVFSHVGLQLQAHRPAGRARRRPDGAARCVRRPPARQLRAAPRRARAACGPAHPAAHPARVPTHSGSGSRSRCARAVRGHCSFISCAGAWPIASSWAAI